MNAFSLQPGRILPLAMTLIGLMGGCRREAPAESETAVRADPQAAASAIGPESSALEPHLDDGWCGGHGVPESVCTRCNAALIPQFKEAGDWCSEHGLPESQCALCHPDVPAKWAALDPSRTAAEAEPAELPPVEPATGPTSAIIVEAGGRRRALGDSDPLCQIENSRIRFRDRAIAQQAGIESAPVGMRRMSAAIEVPAEVQFDARRVTRISPRVPGVVRAVRVQVGAEVDAGALLAVLDSPVIGETKSAYIERQQDLAVAAGDQERIETIAAGIAQMLAVVTSAATAAEIQTGLAGAAIGEARARLLRAHANLQLARATAEREARLFGEKIGAEKDLQAAQAGLAAAEAEFLALREEIAFTSQRERRAAERSVQVARAALEATDRRLRILGLSTEQIAAIGNEPADALSQCEVRSPVAGRIVECNVAHGESVDATESLFVVADTARLWLMASVYERDLPALRAGLPVQFTVDGMPGRQFDAVLTWISAQVDDQSRLVRVRAELANADGLLRANMFGQARIVLRANDEVLSVPVAAIQSDGCCQLAFVREADDVWAPRKVRLGAREGDFVEVVRGLAAGEVIATAGTFLMKTEILKGNIGAGCCAVETGR